MRVSFRRVMGKAPPQPPTAVIRIRADEIAQNDKSGFGFQENNMHGFFFRQAVNPEGAAWDRTYLIGDRYECRVPIR